MSRVDSPGATSRVRFGLSTASVADVVADARRIEQLGFDYLAVGEHLTFHTPTPNAFVSLASAAAVTSRIRLISAVTQLPLYPAALVAKLAAALDVVSGGRFELGIGVAGENPREFDACGVPLKERGARTDEAIRIIRRLWNDEQVSYQGRFALLDDITISPAPIQPGGPPLWVSGRRRSAVRRAADLGDGWLPYLFSPEMIRRSIADISARRDQVQTEGRSPLRCGAVVFVACHPDEGVAIQFARQHLGRQYNQDFTRVPASYFIAGTPDQCREQIEQFAASGCSLIIFASACPIEYRFTNEQLIADIVIP